MPETLLLLRERAVQDEDASVRSAAVSALAEYYREDAHTLPLLRERAVQDEIPMCDVLLCRRWQNTIARMTNLAALAEACGARWRF